MIATLLEQRGDVAGAERAYERATRLGHVGAACNLGVLLEKRGDLEGAARAYRRADKAQMPTAPSTSLCCSRNVGA